MSEGSLAGGPRLQPADTLPFVSLKELLDFARPLRDPIRTSGKPYAQEIETRLDVSARHLSTVELGRQFEPWWHEEERMGEPNLATDHATVITAAQTLVFAGAQACLDLCASAIVHWHGVGANRDRDHDLSDLKSQRTRELGFELEGWARNWRNQTTGDDRYRFLDRYRGAQVHRIVRRSATVRLGTATNEAWLSPSPAEDPTDPVDDAYCRVAEFTRSAWAACWTALSAAA